MRVRDVRFRVSRKFRVSQKAERFGVVSRWNDGFGNIRTVKCDDRGGYRFE